MRNVFIVAAIVIGSCAISSNQAAGQFDINWLPTDPANWNVDANWDPGVPNQPMFGFDVGVINNGGTAFVVDMPPPAAGVILGQDAGESGFLEIRAGGQLNVVQDAGQGGFVRVGENGLGGLEVQPGGALNTFSLSVAGAADSQFSMSGNAALDVGSDANLARTARITGPAVSFDVGGDLSLGGTLIAEITGPTHSAINVTNAANLGGTLQVEFNGHSPLVGDSWTIVNASSFAGSFAALDTSTAPSLPRGAVYSLGVNIGGNGQVNLAVEGRLILSLDRATGATSISNAGAAVDFDSYSILSDNGLLSQGGWAPFQTSGVAGAGWETANPSANHLSELNLLGSAVINTDGSLSLGNAYQSGPVLPRDEDVIFSYTTPDGRVLDGIVEFTGPVNDLVLRVDPMTGDAAIQNLSAFVQFDIDSYTITSESGSLVPANWDSFQSVGLPGQGWEEANPRDDHLSELNLTSSKLFGTNTQIEIGQIFDAASGLEDLIFGYTTPAGDVALGTVEYGEIIPVAPGQVGDTNGDGRVDIDDLNNVRNNFGTDGLPDGSLAGDAFPFDGMVNIDDLNNVRNNFGAAPAAVPEPSTWLLLVSCTMTLMRRRRRA